MKISSITLPTAAFISAVFSSPSLIAAASIRGGVGEAKMVESSASENVDGSAVVGVQIEKKGNNRGLANTSSWEGTFISEQLTMPGYLVGDAEITVNMDYFIVKDSNGNDMGCQHASMKVTRLDSDTGIPESLRLSFTPSGGRWGDQGITNIKSDPIFGFRRSAVPHFDGLGQGSTDLYFDAADY